MAINNDKAKRLSILILPGIIPFPPNDGGKLCIFGFIDYLRSYHNIYLLLSAESENDKNQIETLKKNWPEVAIFSIDSFQPYIKPSLKRRTLSLVRSWMSEVASRLKKKRVIPSNAYDWYHVFHTTPFYPHELNYIQELERVLSYTRFDIIQTELTWMLNLVHLFPSDAKKVFVQIENRSEVLYDYGIANNIDEGYLRYVVKNTEFLEYSYMAKYDSVFVLNEIDKNRFQEKLPGVKVYNSPFGILDKDIEMQDFQKCDFQNLIFMGSESHYPNLDGLQWFLTEIIPLFLNRPFKKLYITGTWKEETKRRLMPMSDCIEFIGFVENLDSYLINSISIVPIRIGGGGIRTKILFAMAKGSPVVATPISTIGISNEHEKDLMIADTSVEFAAAIDLIFNDKKKAFELAANAFNLIKSKFSQQIVCERRNRYYLELTTN